MKNKLFFYINSVSVMVLAACSSTENSQNGAHYPQAVPVVGQEFPPPSVHYGPADLVYARRTNYTHDRRPESFRGKKDYLSAKGKSSTGLPLREAGHQMPAIFAVSMGSIGDIWIDLYSNEVGFHGDTVGTTRAARSNWITVSKKEKVGRKWKIRCRSVCLHKTKEQLHAPVVDECKNRPLSGPDYGYFLMIPRVASKPFQKLKLSEKRRELVGAFVQARLVQASYIRTNRTKQMVAKH